MSALFAVNFRREAYAKEQARARRRVFMLGAWVAYFGGVALLLGLYGLNCVSMVRRAGQVERRTARLRGAQGAGIEWSVGKSELAQVERYVLNPRQWHDRLFRLATILPPNVKLRSLVVNPQNLSNPADQNKLVLTGQQLATASPDRMQGVMKIVSTLHDDSLFARSYNNIELASTRVSEPDGAAEFVIECR